MKEMFLILGALMNALQFLFLLDAWRSERWTHAGNVVFWSATALALIFHSVSFAIGRWIA